ncbi:MAG TPA: hypothetical protein VKD43_06565 [Xanthobacteraceae bacterium]|nr:hypothetical protein [Xanthobacteraceae bacterium]
MHQTIEAPAATGNRVLSDNSLRQHGVLIGGIAAGLALVGLATYTFGSATSTTPPIEASMGASACEAQPISIVFGQDAEATMTVSPRTRCPIVAGSSASSTEQLTIVDPPKHGTLMQGGTGMVYQSNGNYRGQDSFAFAMRGKTVDAYAGPYDGTSIVRANVTVK